MEQTAIDINPDQRRDNPTQAAQQNVGNPTPVRKILLSILAIIILFLVGATSYYLGARRSKPTHQSGINKIASQLGIIKTPTATPTPIVPTATPTPDPTASWNVYTNQKYNFSVKYPTDLQANEQSTYYYYVEFDLPRAANGSAYLPPFIISVIPDTFIAQDVAAYNYMSSDWIASLYAMKIGDVKTTSSGATFTRLADTIVAGQSALVEAVNATGFKEHRVYVKNNSNIYMLANYYQLPEELPNFNNFLSTFKFTQ